MNTDLLLGLKRRDMEDFHSLVTLDSSGSRSLEGRSSQSPETESQESEKSYTFFTRRCRGPAGRKMQSAPKGNESARMQYWGRPYKSLKGAWCGGTLP